MTPAQRRKKIAKYKKSKSRTGPSLGKFFLPLGLLLGALLYLWLTGRTFIKNSKITVVVNGPSQVYVSTFDREGGSVTNLIIPGSTQLNVSRQLGTWKAGSLWQLGENEKLTGILLAETVLKNFKIPVTAWADYPFYGISQGKLNSIFASFLPYKTNLGMGDKIRLALFSLTISPAKRVSIDLAKENFLRKTKLVGGEEGYVVGESLPQSFYDLFSDSRINSANLKIEIQNYSGRKSGAEIAAGVLEVFGGKASAITKNEPKNFFCEVAGRDKKIAQKIARIFGCKVNTKKETDNFDLTIKIGEEFVKRF